MLSTNRQSSSPWPLQDLSLSGLRYLNLHNCGLRKIENLHLLKDLKV